MRFTAWTLAALCLCALPAYFWHAPAIKVILSGLQELQVDRADFDPMRVYMSTTHEPFTHVFALRL